MTVGAYVSSHWRTMAPESCSGISMPNTANIDNQSLRSFLRMVETDHPEELLRIRQPVDTRFEMTAIVFELERAGKSPIVIFENPTATGTANSMPVVTNVAGNRTLLAACLGVEPKDLPTAFRERCQKYIPCEVVKDASWHDVVIEGDALDLTKLPIPLQFTDRWRSLHHRGPDFGARSCHRRRYHRLSPTDAQGQEPLGPLAPFAPPHV